MGKPGALRSTPSRRAGSASLCAPGWVQRACIFGWLAGLLLASCAGAPERVVDAAPPGVGDHRSAQAGGPDQLRVEVLASLPHDPAAFTQGLVWDEGRLYESTGLHGRSSVRQVDPATGQVRAAVSLDPRFFGEGLALVGNRLIQLTWQEGVAFVYDRDSLEQLDTYAYLGEGWGLCYDGARLVMSDGSGNLTFRDPQSFEVLGSVPVTLRGALLERLNELECVGDSVYANVWQTDQIVRIDPQTGRVIAAIDAAGLLSPLDRAGADVLNGIAFDPRREVFLITGKLWPRIFEVRFVPRS